MQKIIPLFIYVLFVHVSNKSFSQSDIRLSVSSSYSSCYVGRVQSDENGGLMMSGMYSRDIVSEFSKLYINEKSMPILGKRGFYLVKLDEKREITWGISIEIKSTNNEVSPQVTLDDSSNIYLSGKFHGQLTFDNKNVIESATGDDFVAKYTAKGELRWVKKLTGTSNLINYMCNIDKNNNLYLIGKYVGNLVYENRILHTATNEQSYLLILDRNGKYMKSESFEAKIDVKFVDTNENNEVCVAGDYANEAVVQGVSVKSAGGTDIFYAKFDSNLKLQWLKSAGGIKDDICRGLKSDGIGNAYLAGYITNQANFDDFKLDFNSEIGSNIFLTQINAQNGKVSWMRNIEYGVDISYVYGPVMTVDILQLNEKKEVLLAGIGTGFITNNKDFNFSNDLWVQYLLKYDGNGFLNESKGDFVRQSYNPASWGSITTRKGGYMYASFNIDSPSRGTGITGIVQFFKSTEVDNCKNNSFLIQRKSSGVFSLAENYIDNKKFNYQWYRNGQYLLNENGFTLKANEPGYYSLKLINKTNSACEVSSLNSIPIFPQVLSTPSVLNYDSYNETLYTTSPNADKIEWYHNGILIKETTSTVMYYPQNGIYKTKEYFANSTIIKESNEVNIERGGLEANIKKDIYYDDGDRCKPVPYLRLVLSSGAPLWETTAGVQIKWFLNGELIKDSTKNHFKAIKPGEYQVSIVIDNPNWRSTSGKYKIVAEDFPKSLPITKIEDVCGANALLKVDDSFIQRYGYQSIFWRVDDKVIPDANQPFYRANKGGYYTFSVQYIEPNTGKTCTYNSFTTFEKKNDFKLNLGYAYAGSGCVVDSFKVFTEQNARYSYTWAKNDVPIEKQTSSEIFIKDKARYKVIVKRNDGCVNETDEISLKGCTSDEFEKFLLINSPLIVADKKTIYPNEKAVLSVEGCSNVNLQWMKDSKLLIGATQKTLEVGEMGNYTLKLEKFGCVATTNAVRISVETILGIGEEKQDFNIEVYPNPTEEKLFIAIPTINTPVEVKLTDISGKLISNYDFSASNNQFIDLKSLEVGVYLLVFEMQGKRIVKKIIKNN